MMQASKLLTTWTHIFVIITFATFFIHMSNWFVSCQTIELQQPRIRFARTYSPGQPIPSTFTAPDSTQSKLFIRKGVITYNTVDTSPERLPNVAIDQENHLGAGRPGWFSRFQSDQSVFQPTRMRSVFPNEKNVLFTSQARRKSAPFQSGLPMKNKPMDEMVKRQENTTQARWWLDTIAKLLHSHPLMSDGQSRLYSASLIDLEPNSDIRSDSDSPYTGVSSGWNHPSPMLFGQNTFPESNSLRSINHGSSTVVGWRKQQRSSAQLNNAWTNNQIRERIQLYRKMMSPKQWKQFIAQTIPGQNNAQFNLALFEASVIGVRRAVAECRYQFRNERWNCSQVPNTDTVLFGNLLLKGIPQTAFVYSIINAGIVQSVAEACLGRIDNCPCNNQGRESSTSNWQWQGCDHNIHYSRKFSRRLLDTMEQGSHIRFRMNLHNNRVGRQLVMKNMERYCRCHGTSGSCTLRTCYRRTPRMRTLGNLLKQIYETNSVRIHSDSTFLGAKQMRSMLRARAKGKPNQRTRFQQTEFKISSNLRFEQDGAEHWNNILRYASSPRWSKSRLGSSSEGQSLSIRSKRQPAAFSSMSRGNQTRQIGRTQLVYYETVPHGWFCDANPRLHIPGTHHRLCNSTSTGSDSCEQLCCGRGFLTNHYYAMESCNCKFIWCCRVQCQQCLVLKKMEMCL